MTVNTIIKRAIKQASCFICAVSLLLLSGCAEVSRPGTQAPEEPSDILYSSDFEMTDRSVVNPFMGFAVDATSKKAASEYSLVYIDITFRELQPDSPDSFAFEVIAEANDIELWRSEGKHAVLRFICDKPRDEAHMDIPDWLYELTGDGTVYDTSYGKGYSPNYSNEIFIKYHKAAISALAEYFSDGFVSYVELGSLGHWGEWHVKREDGIVPMPQEAVREEYVSHYIEAFTEAKLLMRRPFKGARDNGLGLYNDMAGDPKSTNEWLDWIEHGGEYTQTGEAGALYAMPDFWKTAPAGGELTSSLSMEHLCGEGLEETIELLSRSHTTFIGPKVPVSSSDKYNAEIYKNAASELIRAVGYRLGVTRMEIKRSDDGEKYLIRLRWENAGTAPLYFDLPVKLYLREQGETVEIYNVDINLTELLPGESLESETEISTLGSGAARRELALAIIDPMTGEAALELVSDQELDRKQAILYKFDPAK